MNQNLEKMDSKSQIVIKRQSQVLINSRRNFVTALRSRLAKTNAKILSKSGNIKVCPGPLIENSPAYTQVAHFVPRLGNRGRRLLETDIHAGAPSNEIPPAVASGSEPPVYLLLCTRVKMGVTLNASVQSWRFFRLRTQPRAFASACNNLPFLFSFSDRGINVDLHRYHNDV